MFSFPFVPSKFHTFYRSITYQLLFFLFVYYPIFQIPHRLVVTRSIAESKCLFSTLLILISCSKAIFVHFIFNSFLCHRILVISSPSRSNQSFLGQQHFLPFPSKSLFSWVSSQQNIYWRWITKLLFYLTIGFDISRTYTSLKSWTKKYMKFWPSQICINP
jgi:hypothetical protein